jgi:hypothetical protein
MYFIIRKFATGSKDIEILVDKLLRTMVLSHGSVLLKLVSVFPPSIVSTLRLEVKCTKHFLRWL